MKNIENIVDNALQRAGREQIRELAIGQASQRAAKEIVEMARSNVSVVFLKDEILIARMAAIIYRAFREAKEL